MRQQRNGNDFRFDFDSLDDLASFVDALPPDVRSKPSLGDREHFTGARSLTHATELARLGWSKDLDATIAIADAAVDKIDREYEVGAFLPVYDVSGVEVDVARFLDDEPECMVDYPLTPIVKAGRVIALCASVCFSAAVSARSIERRGRMITALALTLARAGYASELWADVTYVGYGEARGKTMTMRTCVKSASDVIDPERIQYAFAHPSMLRCLGFACAATLPGDYAGMLDSVSCQPGDPPKDLPEGTIYLPSVTSDRDIPDLDKALLGYLRELEIIQD